MPRGSPSTESGTVFGQDSDQRLHDGSLLSRNFITPIAAGSAAGDNPSVCVTPAAVLLSSPAALGSQCSQTEKVVADTIESFLYQSSSVSPPSRVEYMEPLPPLASSSPPPSCSAKSSLEASVSALLPDCLFSSWKSTQTAKSVDEGSASTSLASSASALKSSERRSVTVMLDEHLLASASALRTTPLACKSADVWPSPTMTEDRTCEAVGQRPSTQPASYTHDCDSPNHAVDEEMRLIGSFDDSGGVVCAIVPTETAPVDAVRGALPTLEAGILWSGSKESVGAKCISGLANVSAQEVSTTAARGACGSYRSSSNGAALEKTSSKSPQSSSGNAGQPTPYPVTSVSSLHDWSSVPRLGFPPPTDPCGVHAELLSRRVRDEQEHKRERRWHRLCRGVSLLASASPEAIVQLRAVARECGIPHHLRGVMWLTLTGMALKVDENEYFCAELLRRNGYVTGPNAVAIAADVQRTFPCHPYFSDKDVGIYKLTNVLHALCWRNPLLSYCQSFNYLAAFLLLVLDDEERVFWLLTHIFEDLLPNDFYGETLLGANVEQTVLEHLVEKKLPRIAAKFREAGLQVKTLVANWNMSLFVNVFPIETTLHVWDYFFCRTPTPGERTPAHLEVTLATLKYLDDAGVLKSGDDAGELLASLREHTACLFDAATLLRLAQSLAITPAQLHHLRRQCKPAVVVQMKAREQARAEQREFRVAQELCVSRQKRAGHY
ncbi:hypothetical protein JKF63_00513 [Porcisia hertigi]|uniref:Rab-GAP TBC domain-containing protein n=1 Tax=Porcisia hertigi TaxID=2761500 RepID=A0A836I9Q0_9TRYP|nr:hypothetical protein JKF63_00513 [Porcisia hertigi]